jgi:hypothetical protein
VKGHDLLALAEENPYTGTARQVITLCIGIYEASVELDAQTMRALRNELPITDKIYSKLRVIGKTCCALPTTQRQVVMKALPDSYSTIHVLCGLKPQELHTAAKSKRINRTTSIRSARDYVRQVRFPALTGNPEATPPTLTTSRTEADPTWKTLLTIHEDPTQPLTPEQQIQLHTRIAEVCLDHGVEVRRAEDTSIRKLQQDQRTQAETFWRGVLEDLLPQTWFDELPQDLRTQFNLKTVQEVYKTPLRQFTGLLIRSTGGRKKFWEQHGRTYIAKLHLEMAETTDRIRRNNHKRRLEEVFADQDGTRGGRDLAVWNNKMLRGAGLPIL